MLQSGTDIKTIKSFIKSIRLNKGSGRRDYASPYTIKILRKHAGLSRILVARATQAENWTRLGESCFLQRDEQGKVQTFGRYFTTNEYAESDHSPTSQICVTNMAGSRVIKGLGHLIHNFHPKLV